MPLVLVVVVEPGQEDALPDGVDVAAERVGVDGGQADPARGGQGAELTGGDAGKHQHLVINGKRNWKIKNIKVIFILSQSSRFSPLVNPPSKFSLLILSFFQLFFLLVLYLLLLFFFLTIFSYCLSPLLIFFSPPPFHYLLPYVSFFSFPFLFPLFPSNLILPSFHSSPSYILFLLYYSFTFIFFSFSIFKLLLHHFILQACLITVYQRNIDHECTTASQIYCTKQQFSTLSFIIIIHIKVSELEMFTLIVWSRRSVHALLETDSNRVSSRGSSSMVMATVDLPSCMAFFFSLTCSWSFIQRW